MRRAIQLIALAALVPLLVPAPALAQTGSVSGEFLIGYRSVSTDGSENKYKEDINLDDGPRLFNLKLDFVPSGELRSMVDEVRLDMDNYGGDPFETLHLGVRKFGSYSFRFDRRKSEYFYEDIIEPVGLSNPALAFAGDFHHFDYERVHDTASLDVDLNQRAKLSFGFDRYTKRGESTTTLDISRDEFEFDKPVDESLNSYRVGFSYSWDKVTLVLEESQREFENDVHLFLPGFSLGEDPADATTLSSFFLNQPYETETTQHTLRLIAKPNNKLTVRLSGVIQETETEAVGDERSIGVAFNGNPFTTNLSGAGEIERDVEMFDLDINYLVNDRFALVGKAWQRELDQEGDFFWSGNLHAGLWEVETSGFQGGLQFAVSPKVTVAAGFRVEERDVTHAFTEDDVTDPLDPETETTEQDGLYANLTWRPTRAFDLSLRWEDFSIDDPFTLASPTDRERLTLRGRYRLASGLSLNGTYSTNEMDNSNSGYASSYDQVQVGLAYRKNGFDASISYGNIEIERAVDRVVVTLPGFGGGQLIPLPIDYQADSDFFDARMRWTRDDLSLGASYREYENDGSFALDREDARVFAEYTCPGGYLLYAAYRTVDYNEAQFNFDDYDADITEIAVGYRW